jgi:multicomponent Na+:H+ antiporter subunit E
MIAFILNLLVAFIWFFLGTEPDGSRLLVGMVVGYGMIYLFRGALPPQSYTRRVAAFFVFAFVFLRELVVSNLQLAWIVLTRPVGSLSPAIFTYSVEGLSRLEILLLSHAISLTPGTATVDVEDDFRTLRLHSIDTKDPEATARRIREVVETRILAFTR